VLVQGVLFAGVIGAGLASPRWPKSLQLAAVVIAIVLGAAGLVLAASAVRALGSSVSPFPRPPAASELTERGVYALVRHPIYGGIVLLSLAWSLALGPLALIPTLVLAVVLVFKSRLEERWLIDRHPAYTAYRMRVRRRFVPFLW
jgi:protein-S-isoprenylcysteine O-methyltransferase Ste14